MMRGEARACRPGSPVPSAGVECPYIGAQPLVQWSLAAPMEAGFGAKIGTFEPELSAARDRRNLGTVAPSHQDAILGLAEFGDAHREPYADRGQCDGEGEGGEIRQHAVTKIVRLLPRPLIARQVVGLLPGVLLRWTAGRLRRCTRPEPEHAVFVIRTDWPLGFHCCWSEASVSHFSTPAGFHTRTSLAWHRC